MRRLLLGLVFVLTLVAANSAFACKVCSEYWSYEAQTWCKFCDDPVPCGVEQCDVVQEGQYEFCRVGGICFTVRRHCPFEPEVRFDEPRTAPGAWKLVRAEIRVPKKS